MKQLKNAITAKMTEIEAIVFMTEIEKSSEIIMNNGLDTIYKRRDTNSVEDVVLYTRFNTAYYMTFLPRAEYETVCEEIARGVSIEEILYLLNI